MPDFAINGIDLGRGRGGNESYLAGLISGLEQVARVRDIHVLVGSHFHQYALTTKTQIVQTGAYHRLPYLFWTQSLALRKLRYDWFLSTFFLPIRTPHQSALFVHDLSFLTLPGSYPLTIRLYMQALVASSVRRAHRIFVLSNFVRTELCHYYPFLASERVCVLYPGYSEGFQPLPGPSDGAVLQKYGLVQGYILTVSSIHPRKNLQGLLNAHQLLKQRFALHPHSRRLVVVGQQYWGNHGLREQATTSGVDLLGYVPQADLPALYRGAGLFVYPSLYEGFGLPPIEALASGVPVICGDNTSLPEVVGDAAQMVDTSVPAAMADAMGLLLFGDESGERRIQLVKTGLEWVKRFSWRQTAEHLVDALTK